MAIAIAIRALEIVVNATLALVYLALALAYSATVALVLGAAYFAAWVVLSRAIGRLAGA
jgi:hypothetical protein